MLDPRTHQPTNPFQLYDETRRHRPHHSYYSTWEATNSGFWPSKTETQSKEEEVDESGMCSPPLWTTSPPASPPRDGINNNRYRSLSPASRTQAIVRGQRELMEMVRNMPESNYELSLKDLVEHHRVQQNNTVVVEQRRNLKGGGGSGRNVVKRSGAIDRGSGGFYLKMVFPSFSFGSKNKNKKNNNKNKKQNESSSANSCSKVSPRPSASDGSVKGGVDKEWWKKSSSGSRESDSGASSIHSGSTKSSGSSSSNNSSSSTSNSRHKHEKSGGRCWPCIPRPKRQPQK